ncbi:MAG: hypothetical protein ACREMN_06455 [Gemmatimonadales bacterium]
MASHHDHQHHLHQPAADAPRAYDEAFRAAQPDPGRRVVVVDLEASEVATSSSTMRPA